MATNFSVKYGKNSGFAPVVPKSIQMVKNDSVDISGLSDLTLRFYTDGDSPVAEFELSGFVLDSLKNQGYTFIPIEVLPSADDEFYTVIGVSSDENFVTYPAGFGITDKMKEEVLLQQGFINVYSPDFRADYSYMTAFMLMYECDNIENIEPSKQKRADFVRRQELLKKMLNY